MMNLVCDVYVWKFKRDAEGCLERVLEHKGCTLLDFSTDSEVRFEKVVKFPVGIVRLENGDLKSVPVDLITVTGGVLL